MEGREKAQKKRRGTRKSTTALEEMVTFCDFNLATCLHKCKYQFVL